ncbi:MAG: HU family DNA-binding protein [Acidobacteria bacterium]|nr:HU family DNA-binding protein [Acidobacteriota bacterium]
MTRSELARQVAERTGMSVADADAAVKAVLAAVAGALGRGETVRLAGFGTFEAKNRPPRTVRNPRTGAPLAVPALRGVRFRAGKALRDAVRHGPRP